MNKAPTFGVVVLNWNNASDTIQCLESLREAESGAECVVVVDNGSGDDSVAEIRRWAEGQVAEPVIIEAKANLGFAGGNNLGIRYLKEHTDLSHVLLLNNDATIAPTFFTEISRALMQVPDAGIITGTIFEHPARDKVWYAGGVEQPLRALVSHNLEVPSSSEPVPTDFVTGCAMVISRPLLDRIGLLAECYYPAYFEDCDYCRRAKDAGFAVIYAPRPTVYHKVGATVRAANLVVQLAYYKNRLRVFYVRRNYRGWTRAFALGYLAVTKPGRSVIEIASGRPRVGWAILSGTISGFVSATA